MSDTPEDSARRPVFWANWEKHATFGLVAVLTFIGLNIYRSADQTERAVAVLQQKLDGFQERIEDWRDDIRDRYEQRFRDMDRRITENKARIERIEEKEGK